MDSPMDEDDKERESTRDKFKREREEQQDARLPSKTRSPDKIKTEERDPKRGRTRDKEKYDEFGRNLETREREPSREREVSPESKDRRERIEKEGRRKERDRYKNEREIYREPSPPPYKRRKKDEEWDEREHDRYRDRPTYYERDKGRGRGNDSYRDRGSRSYFPGPVYDEYETLPPVSENYYPAERRSRSPPPPRVPRPKTELFEGNMKTYKQFLEYQDEHQAPQESEKKYEEYKNEFKKKHSRTFFDEHKKDEWFKEKYSPEYLETKRAQKLESVQVNLKIFSQELAAGTIKFNLSAEDDAEFMSKDKSEQDSAMSLEHSDEPHDEMEQDAEEPDEPKENGEEKTEEKKEDGKEIAKDDKGGEKEGAEPKIISTKPSHPRQHQKLDMSLDALTHQKRDKTDKEKEKITPLPTVPETNTIFIKSIPPSVGRAELMDLFKDTEGFVRMSSSEPMKYKNFNRLGWVTYQTKEQCLKAIDKLNGTKVSETKDFELQLMLNKQNTTDLYKKIKVTPPGASTDERMKVDYDQCHQLAQMLDKERGVEKNPVLTSATDSLAFPEKLDRLILYCRRVHFFCYYCGEEYEDKDDMLKKCGEKHLRKKDSTGQVVVSTEHWIDSLDLKIKSRLSKPDNPDVYTGAELFEKKCKNSSERISKRLIMTNLDALIARNSSVVSYLCRSIFN